MDEKLRIVMVEPGKPAYVTEIPNTLEAEQQAVGGGPFDIVYLDEGILVCNDEGKHRGAEPGQPLGGSFGRLRACPPCLAPARRRRPHPKSAQNLSPRGASQFSRSGRGSSQEKRRREYPSIFSRRFPQNWAPAARENLAGFDSPMLRLRGMEGNRRLDNGSIIAGPFFIVGDAGENFRSLTDAEADHFLQRFSQPEQISQQEVQADMGFMFISF